MTTIPTYSGDLKIVQTLSGDYDINYINGQPEMTDGLETSVLLAVFVEPDTWQNAIASTPEEEYKSDFPEVIRTGKVNDATRKDGEAAITRALDYLLRINAASDIIVTGVILSVFAIGWEVEISRPTGETSRFNINWDKMELTFTRA